MTSAMEQSPLWKRTFAKFDDPTVNRLVTSLRSARDRVGQLTTRIASSLPNLTMHDLSHLDGLWTVAGTISGDDFSLNPLEGYLFGTAVLFHDAALCFEAYSGGQSAVRQTVQWKDAHNRRAANQNPIDFDAVDFEALRNLHALRAASLPVEPWDDTAEGPLYIIDDTDLRTQYGPLIGEIASSHHWNIDDVAERFSIHRPPAALLPQEWTVDPLVIACLLRTADAGHMDSSRAPTFLSRILEMNSVSRAHWTAQNHLGQLTVKPDDPSQVVVASTAPFGKGEDAGWWVAYDLVEQLDKELKQCYSVLSARTRPRRLFACRNVSAAGNVKELSRHIQTDGWEPTNSSVHVSDVAALVGSLGGEQLYGTDADRLAIALRELVQNAADAVSARRLVEGRPDFKGHLRISLRLDGNTNRYILRVDDDGVGMSTRTLCDDLLDFGSSFWASERASQEFPGLHAAGHSPRGRFGIGFFSVFMAASSVRVFSRRFNKGIDDVRCLSFPKGLSLRPTLAEERPHDFSMDVCTRVELVLKPLVVSDPSRIRIRRAIMGQEDLYVSFVAYVAALVSGIDVPVSVQTEADQTKVHNGFPPDLNEQAEWLRRLAYISDGANQQSASLVTPLTARLREIRDGNVCYGLAAISIDRAGPCDFLSAKTVGGLTARDQHYTGDPFVGVIDHLPRSAKRDPGDIAVPRKAIESWLVEQVNLLGGRLSAMQSMWASYSLCSFDYDAIDVLQSIPVITSEGVSFWLLSDLSHLLSTGNRLGFRVSNYGTLRLEQNGEQESIQGIATCLIVENGKFNEADMTASGPKKPKSLVGLVHRTLVAQGASPTWSTHPNMYRAPISGKCDCLEVRI